MPAFRHYVDVIGPGTQADSHNQIVGAPFTKISNVACSIETVSGGEVRRGQQMQATVNRLVTMRFFEGAKAPTTDDKLVVLGEYDYIGGNKVARQINILAAHDPDGRRRQLIVQGRSNA